MGTNDIDIEILSEEDKRENRRLRRIKNQRLAYAGLILFILLLVGGIVGAMLYTNKKLKSKKENVEEVVQLEEEPATEIIEEIYEENIEEVQEEKAAQEEDEQISLLEEKIDSIIAEMTLEEKVAGLFVVTPEGITGVSAAIQAGDGTKKALEEYPVGGLVYFKKNIKSKEQIKEMISNSKSYCKYPLFIGIEEEGGKISYLADTLKLDNTDSLADIGSTGDVSKSYESMKTVGTYMSEHGFNLNFAPVANVMMNEDNLSDGARTFGSDPDVVAQMVNSGMNGLEEMGITACIKYFPGMKEKDSDAVLSVIDKPLEELRQNELIPFMSAIENGVSMIMVGHISLPQITGDNTSVTMSELVISELLRGDLGYNGVVITDAMNIEPITQYYGADEAAIRALKAGADMILMPEDFELAYQGVITAVKDGTISEERINDSLKRVYRIKVKD